MAPTTGLPSGAKKRKTLWEVINKAKQTPDDVIFEMMKDIAAQDQKYRRSPTPRNTAILHWALVILLIVSCTGDFRWNAPATQRIQDRTLDRYTQFMVSLYRGEGRPPLGEKAFEAMSKQEQDRFLWPSDSEALFTQCRIFLWFVAANVSGRSHRSNRISYQSLASYRGSLMFWDNRVRAQHGWDQVTKTSFYNTLTTGMRAAAKSFNLSAMSRRNTTEVGLSELRLLIDFDMASTLHIEVAEQHHLAWCIGRVCSVRPGTIGWPEKEYMEQGLCPTWRDFTFSRCEGTGTFKVSVTFRMLKTNSQDPETMSKISPIQQKLTFTILSPNSIDNLIFSIPHRLLTIALRRKLIYGMETIDQLFDGTSQYITIKPDHLDDPVFIGSRPRGLGLSEDSKPMSSKSLSAYLTDRGQKVGFSEAITFYSIRRRSALHFTRLVGRDNARALMAHDAGSRILENYYVDMNPTTDVTGLALGEVSTSGDRIIEESNDLAIHVLREDRARMIHGPALNALIRKIINNDPDYPFTASLKELKNYRKRVRWSAFQTLLSEESQRQRAEMSHLTYKDRVSRLNASSFVDHILRQAQQCLKSAPNQVDDLLDEGNALVDPATGELVLPEDVADDPPDEDAEDRIEEGQEPEVLGNAELEEDGNGDVTDTVTYDLAAKVFMGTLLENQLTGRRDWKNNPIRCPLCVDDHTVDESQRVCSSALTRFVVANYCKTGKVVGNSDKVGRPHARILPYPEV